MNEMDDHQFDESIKRKVGDYEEQAFDPASLAALHHQMATLTVWPWYSHYRTELLIAAGFVLTTLLIVSSQWLMNHKMVSTVDANIIKLKEQHQQQVAELRKEIQYLRSTAPDTIETIVTYKQTPTIQRLLFRIENLEAILRKPMYQPAPVIPVSSDSIVRSQDTSPNWNEQYSYLSITPRISPREKNNPSMRAKPVSNVSPGAPSGRSLSVKSMRDLERHYRNGIGIRIGPTLGLSKGFYQEGKGDLDINGGVVADFVMSPSLSLETGVKYSHSFYEVSEPTELLISTLPGVDESLGPLLRADIDSWIYEIPITLKYWYPLSMRSHLIAGLGYSSFLYSRQVFEYDYQVDNNPSIVVSSDYKMNEAKFYNGTVNLSLGLSHQLKNRKILETSIYYQQSIGELGMEKSKLDFLGVKGVYWFSIR